MLPHRFQLFFADRILKGRFFSNYSYVKLLNLFYFRLFFPFKRKRTSPICRTWTSFTQWRFVPGFVVVLREKINNKKNRRTPDQKWVDKLWVNFQLSRDLNCLKENKVLFFKFYFKRKHFIGIKMKKLRFY